MKLVITRHRALVELLRERGVLGDEEPFEVIEHATVDQIRGKHVIGVLPIDMAAQAASVTLLPLALAPEDRGKELTIERLRQIAAPACETYTVLRVVLPVELP